MSPPESTPAHAGSGAVTGAWRRNRAAVLIGAAVLVVLAITALTAREPETSATYDPANPSASGARATAEVLRDRDVEVTVVRSVEELEAEPAGAGTTVVVTSTELLGRNAADRLLEHAGAADLVVVEPGPGATEALAVDPLPTTAEPAGPVAAECDDPALADLELEVDRALAFRQPGCFGVEDGVLVAQPRAGLTLLGAGEALRNDQVLRADNAATVLRLLGRQRELVWYVPALTDLTGEDGVSLESLLPGWLRPAFLLVLLGAVAGVVWRGRRLGPLATEPLPVVVKALETTRSRGRLYRRAGDRDHAAAALRRATRRRLAVVLARSPHDEAGLVAHLTSRLGRPAGELSTLLGAAAPAPTTDEDLTDLARALAALEEEVRHP